MLTLYERKIKRINYEVKFSTISILKNKIEKTYLKKIITKIQKKKEKKKESRTLWISIVIHNGMGVGEQSFPHIL